jgi:hypothetical protein
MRQIRAFFHGFWEAYHRHYLATLTVTTAVFLLQLFHLYWLFSDVILTKLTGHSHFVFPQSGMIVYVLADYLEIPALVSASLLYIYELRRQVTFRALLYVILLNTQWIHMFWITDQVVVDSFAGHSLISWNGIVAWIAILIDYLEVPVIVDSLYKVFQARHEIWARIRANTAAGRAARAAAVSGGATGGGTMPPDAKGHTAPAA